MFKVSIIILNYKSKDYLTNCLESLKKSSFKNFKVIVVNNDSNIDLNDLLKSFSELNIQLVSLDFNKGFCGGNIEGLKYSTSEYVVLLNNDTEVDKYWLEELVKSMDSNKEVGICASKILVSGTDNIDSAGDGFARSLKGFKRGEGENKKNFISFDYVFGACAGAALYRKKMLDEIGFLDEDFFLIHEDTDLNFRAQLYGWKVLYVPTAIVYHKVRSSIGNMSDLAIFYSLRNSEFVRIKNVPIGVFIVCLPEFIIGLIFELLYFVIKHKKLKIYIKAKFEVIKMFLKMLKKRKKIMKYRKVSDKYILSLMTSIFQKELFTSKLKKLINN